MILPGMTGISERVRRVRNELAPAETRVVEALLHDYPMAGLGSVGDLAATAGVSAPTVLRLVAKLGFGGYPEFREHLRGEVAARLFSPVEAYPRAAGSAGDLLATAEKRYAEILATANTAAQKMIDDARESADRVSERKQQEAIAAAEQIVAKASLCQDE